METDPIRIDTSSIASKTQHDKEVRAEARQVSSDESFEAFCDEGAFTNPWATDKKDRFKLLSERRREAKEIKEEPKILAVDKTEDSAKKYQEKNQELDGKKLQNLLKSLKKNDSITDILKKVADYFLDVTLQDDALDFLIENAEGELQETLQRSKEELNRKAGSQIVAGRNIALQAREFSEKGLGTPTALRDLYRDISANPRETNAFFDELSKSYTYDKLKTVIQFLLHSVGSDLRSKGPSIPRGELARLFNETRSLQAILGVYRFFQSRMGLIQQLFTSEELAFPKGLTFETLAKLFMKLLEERYPTGMKILRSAGQLNPEEEIAAMLIIISQWRDGIRNVAPRLYKSGKQRDDLLNAIIEALEELEEQEEERRRKIIEEEEEEEEKKRREKRGK
jgi:type III secretion protein W